jgi:signal transduction histidine kinase/DNA-binding response OmpR family regulator
MSHSILFVDDEPEVLTILRKTFPPSDGYEPLTAPSGKEALAILAARDIDLLVTDQRMPGMTGIELIAHARRTRPDLCAILLTAYTDPRDLVNAINLGEVYRYVTKPWEANDLRQTVIRALEQVHLKRDRARLTAELERRLRALEAASEIAREVGEAEGPSALVERVLARLPAIVPCDAAAALLAPEGGAARLHVRPVAMLTPAALEALREGAAASFLEQAGRPAGPVEVNVIGAGGARAPGPLVSRLTLPVMQDGAPIGVVVLASAEGAAFGEGDARVLDALVNEVGEGLRALAARLGGERRRLERVIESLADGLVFAPREGTVVANPAARRMLGDADAERLSPAWLEASLGFSPQALLRDRDGTGGPHAIVGPEIRRGDRTLAPIVSAVPDGGGRPAGVAVVLRDVTEQKQLEARKEEFVHVVSHELRTPLTAIAGALDLVLGGLVGPLEAKQEKYLRMARESSDRLSALVDDILDVARLARGKLRMEPEPVRLDELVRQAVDRYQAAASERGLALDVAVPSGPVRTLADPGRIGQVLANLLTNSLKFSPERGEIRVRLFRSAALPGLTGLSVWNGGEAIAEKDLERIFEKFEQARSAGNRRARGTGLGLAICRGIVEAHGGRIWAESAPGEGVRIVLVVPDEPPAPAPERTEPAGRCGEAPWAVIADEPDTAALARAVLELRGFRCRTAADAGEAVGLVRRLRPRLVVWDPGHPPLASLGEVLRHDPDARQTTVLAFWAGPREPALRAGAAAVVERPCAPAHLAAAAQDLLGRGPADRTRVLVVDDDPAIRAICAEVLAGHGYEVVEAGSCEEARRAVLAHRPRALLVDVQLPDGEGFDLLETLAAARAEQPFATVFLSARGEVHDKVRGLRLGADDYVTKPFDARELVARIDAAVARGEVALAASPMTRLPGGPSIDREVERRLQAGTAFALSYVDLDNLKAFNDHYGYAKADGVVRHAAGILREAAAGHGGDGAFLGHVGGDDFVLLAAPERVDGLCRQVIAAFDRAIPLHYDREDRARGFIEAADRAGQLRRFPLMTVTIASVVAAPGRFERHADLARAAAALKERAKRIAGSVHLVDAGDGGACG